MTITSHIRTHFLLNISGRAVERSNRADANFFEQLFKLTDGVLDAIFGGSSESELAQLHQEVHRVFRTPNFNSALHKTISIGNRSRCGWRELPNSTRKGSKTLMQVTRGLLCGVSYCGALETKCSSSATLIERVMQLKKPQLPYSPMHEIITAPTVRLPLTAQFDLQISQVCVIHLSFVMHRRGQLRNIVDLV